MAIEVRNIRKSFGSFTALDDVSLTFSALHATGFRAVAPGNLRANGSFETPSHAVTGDHFLPQVRHQSSAGRQSARARYNPAPIRPARKENGASI